MRTTASSFSILGAIGLVAGLATAWAGEGIFYDPSNAASPTGKTIGYELFRTIGCPGRQLLGKPCPVPTPVDSDGDGVVDGKDQCPDTLPGRKVNADGCEPDRDGDGVVDSEDRCPDTFARTADGCPPVVSAEPASASAAEPASIPVAEAATTPTAPSAGLILKGANFDFDQVILRPEDLSTMARDAENLKNRRDVDVEIAGHTDSVGTRQYNMKLSLRRAEAVRTYLIGKGVAPSRLTTQGYGESRPIADNATAEGRAKNRRVDLIPLR